MRNQGNQTLGNFFPPQRPPVLGFQSGSYGSEGTGIDEPTVCYAKYIASVAGWSVPFANPTSIKVKWYCRVECICQSGYQPPPSDEGGYGPFDQHPSGFQPTLEYYLRGNYRHFMKKIKVKLVCFNCEQVDGPTNIAPQPGNGEGDCPCRCAKEGGFSNCPDILHFNDEPGIDHPWDGGCEIKGESDRIPIKGLTAGKFEAAVNKAADEAMGMGTGCLLCY